jgi:flagellar hook protein FlgE
MISGLTGVSTGGLSSQRAIVDMAAHNLANLNTPGFKSTSVQVSQNAAGFPVVHTATRFQQGPMQVTGSPSELAIGGRGFFAVQNASGATLYTRKGNFIKDREGFLQTPNGEFLLGAGNARVRIPPDSTSFSIDGEGNVQTISSMGVSSRSGSVQIAKFPNENGLVHLNDGLLSASVASGAPNMGVPGTDGLGTLHSGVLEMSNVDLAHEMVSMMVAQRAFEANLKVIQASDQMLGTLIRTIPP